MAEPTAPMIRSEGDLEAVVLSEFLDLFAGVIHPDTYTVVGEPGEQSASFKTSSHLSLFYLQVHEYFATESNVTAIPGGPSVLSLHSGLAWLINRYPEEAKVSGLAAAHERLSLWSGEPHQIICWSGEIGRHLRFRASIQQLISIRANLDKHQFFKISRQLERLQRICRTSGCEISLIEAIQAREECQRHIDGMLVYHSTELVEYLGECFWGAYRLVRSRALPRTNLIDDIPYPPSVSDPVFRFMYATTIWRYSGYTEDRIRSCIPSTASCWKNQYGQHAEWEVVEQEQEAGERESD